MRRQRSDSLVLGEPQILGQVKSVCGFAKATLTPALERMFQKSLSVAKRVRTENDIGASAVLRRVCRLVRSPAKSSNRSTVTVLLAGAGEPLNWWRVTCASIKYKDDIANRTRERAQAPRRMSKVGAEVVSLSDNDARLQDADISSTASPLPIIGKGNGGARRCRRNQPMLLVDIAVPRDVEPEVGKLANAYLYSVDDLQHHFRALAQR